MTIDYNTELLGNVSTVAAPSTTTTSVKSSGWALAVGDAVAMAIVAALLVVLL